MIAESHLEADFIFLCTLLYQCFGKKNSVGGSKSIVHFPECLFPLLKKLMVSSLPPPPTSITGPHSRMKITHILFSCKEAEDAFLVVFSFYIYIYLPVPYSVACAAGTWICCADSWSWKRPLREKQLIDRWEIRYCKLWKRRTFLYTLLFILPFDCHRLDK